MAISRDTRDIEQRNGAVQNRMPTDKIRRKTAGNSLALSRSSEIDILNNEIDLQWASAFGGSSNNQNTYYDYYYSGQDIQVYIDGAESMSTGGVIPIVSFGFNIKQEKLPLYGFWSYTFDAIMRGNRIVNGTFTVATTSLNYIKDLLTEAAITRKQGTESLYPIRNLNKDEENIEKYWSLNIDSSLVGVTVDNTRNIWSSHPPFNFVIVYGMQDISISDYNSGNLKRLKNPQNLLVDTNDRLVSENITPTRHVIENVELTSMQVEYTPDGQPVGETYTFIARDLFSYQEKE